VVPEATQPFTSLTSWTGGPHLQLSRIEHLGMPFVFDAPTLTKNREYTVCVQGLFQGAEMVSSCSSHGQAELVAESL
jgi:hypothetical protein